MDFVKRLILNRNSILVFAVFAGILLGDKAAYLKDYTFIALAITMTFSMTGISLKSINTIGKVVKPATIGIVFNYLIFTAVLLTLAWFVFPDKNIFYGFVVIAAAPPGVAIIPFSYILKGKVDYAIIGVASAFVASIVFAPLIVNIFTTSEGVRMLDLFLMMLQLIVAPLLVSRVLLMEKIFKYVEPIRGKVVDWGFALLIFVAVGLNRDIFFTDFKLLLKVSMVLLVGTFGIGLVYELIARSLKVDVAIRIPQNMLVTIKSSGFSVFTAMTLFGKEAAIPSAVLAVVVLVYLISLSISYKFIK